MKTPVALFIFNRPDTTAQVFEVIRQIQPPKLLVIADGDRPNHPTDLERCTATRAIIEQVDWPCEVITNYADSNMGCMQRVFSGLNWVFEQVEEAIILEDDCLPHPSFFQFCEELLEKYRHDSRVGIISGQNSLLGYQRNTDSYYFAQIPYIWGWATWRSRWQLYDFKMSHWPEAREGQWLKDIFKENAVAESWLSTFEHNYEGFFNAWDYQLTFTSLVNNWLNPTANVNLVTNIGFGEGATNTSETGSIFADLATQEISFPLQHPQFMVPDRTSELRVFKKKFHVPTTLKLDRAIRRYWKNRSNHL
jgi:hypothetical protein